MGKTSQRATSPICFRDDPLIRCFKQDSRNRTHEGNVPLLPINPDPQLSLHFITLETCRTFCHLYARALQSWQLDSAGALDPKDSLLTATGTALQRNLVRLIGRQREEICF